VTQITVIIPAKNEAASLASLFSRLHTSLASARISYQAILVDDHSTDATRTITKQLASQYPIVYMRKRGLPGKAYSILEAAAATTTPYLAMLDADLEYPPEAVADMLQLLVAGGHGVVVGSRTTSHTHPLRAVMSRLNRYFLGRWLLGLKCDVQSGLKVFRSDIIPHLNRRHIKAWSFDIPLLHAATQLGFSVGSHPIQFVSRTLGISKCKTEVFRAIREIGLGALQVKLSRPRVYSLPGPQAQSAKGAGVAYRGRRFTTHTHLPSDHSALITAVPWQKFTFITLLLVFGFGLVAHPLPTAIGLIAVLSLVYFADMAFSAWLVLRSLNRPPELTFSPHQLAACDPGKLPLYTVLCPLYKEAEVLPHFVSAISKLDWPKNRLQVLLLLEENDTATIAAAEAANLPAYFEVVIVPHSSPKTKPKACNYGLHQARGDYVVIYDAEDRPEASQLKKAYLGFQALPASVACLQAKLNYYNHSQNWLTRLFTAEYSLWFDVVLPGYQSINTTIPLGGTSNHFKTSVLRSVHGWDAFNVTEDCDLGARLFKLGFQTAVIDSTTLEEANSQVGNWLRQRSRWIKGYFQTFLVHNRHPWAFIRSHGLHAFIFQLVVGGKTFFMLINPILWLATVSYFVFYPQVGSTIEALYPTAVFYLAGACAVFGNFLFLYYYMIGLAKRGHWSLIKYVFLVPLYWLMVSLAAFKAFYQLIVRPHYWEKTVHGLHLPSAKFVISLRINFPSPRLPRLALPRPSLLVSRLLLAGLWLTIQAFGLYYTESYLPAAVGVIVLTVIGFLVSARLTSVLAPSWWLINRFLSDLQGLFNSVAPKPRVSSGQLRILIFNWRDIRHTWAGGAEVYLHQLAKRWVANGHQVTLFCGNDGQLPRDEVIDGVTIIRRGGFYTVYLLAPLYYLFRFRSHFDVIIDSENGIPFFTPLYSSLPKVLLIHHIHQELFRSKLYFPLDQLAAFLERRLMPIIYARQKIVTVSQSSLLDITRLGLARYSDIDIVHPGVESGLFNQLPKTTHPSFVYLGRIRPQKNLDVAIRAFAVIRSRFPKATFTIAGWGDDIPALQGLVSALHLTKAVRFLNRIPESSKSGLLATAWAMLQPSSFEGWGITVIEANAAGTPVIASDVSGLRDSVLANQTGLLVPPEDPQSLAHAMARLISDPALRARLAKNSLAWSQKFNWDTLANQFLSILLLHAQAANPVLLTPAPAYESA